MVDMAPWSTMALRFATDVAVPVVRAAIRAKLQVKDIMHHEEVI